MQRLRNATLLARFVLAWFALSITVAVAAPWAQSAELGQLCSSSGSIQLPADGEDALSAHTWDCPLCVGAAPPVAWFAAQTPTWGAPVHFAALPSGPAAAVAGAPLPARGPPLQGLEV